MLHHTRHIFLLIILIIGGLRIATAQTVGLVMSGGGAKGMVHLGMLKALEENEIPIDYITGTSIGAIVGGMYACGYTVDEIVNYIESSEFQLWLTGDFADEVPAYYKQLLVDAELMAARMYVGEKFSLALPTNLVPPYQMDFALIGMFAQATAAAHGDLNALMLPFRAISTNIYEKKPYSARYGDLGTLLRASMSFPGIFKPVVIDSLLFFDGGIINNFPADVLQNEFNPDLIIGGNCSYNYERPKEDDVISQLYALMSASSKYEVPEDKGWLINFDSLNVDLLAFSEVRRLMERGYKQTMQLIPQIKERVQRRKTQDELTQQRAAFRAKQPPLVFKNIDIEGGTPPLQQYIKSRMRRERDTTIALPTLKYRYFDVISDNGLTTAFPQAHYSPEDSAYSLHLRISPAPNFKVAFGGYFSSGPLQAFTSVAYTYYAPITLRAYANLYFGTIYVSHKFLLRADFRIKRWDFPLFAEMGETTNSYDYYSKNPELVFSDTRPDFMKDNEWFGYFNVGTGTVGNSVLRLGFSGGRRRGQYYQTTNFLSSDIPETMQFNFVLGSLSLENNSLNFKTFPTQGLKQNIDVDYIYGTEWHTYGSTSGEYQVDSSLNARRIDNHRQWRIKAMRTEYFQVNKYLSLGYYLEGVYSQHAQFHFADYYANLLTLSAFKPLQNTYGLFLDNFRSNVYLAAGIIPTYVLAFLSPNVLLRSEIYAFAPFFSLSKDDNQYLFSRPRYSKDFRNIYFLSSISAIWQTPIGNLSFSATYYDRSREFYNSWFFAVNFGYYLNNKRAFD